MNIIRCRVATPILLILILVDDLYYYTFTVRGFIAIVCLLSSIPEL